MWRILVIETARLLQENYKKDLIVPMTIWHKAYFNEIIQGFRQLDPNVHHFCLIASLATIHERLLARGEEPKSWAEKQAEQCVTAFEASDFETKIDTTTKKPSEVLDVIPQNLSLTK